jgi:hypothetical protein
VLDSGQALFYQLLNLITMKISKIKSFVFGLAFLGSMGIGGISVNAQTLGGSGGGADQCKVELLLCSIWTGSTRQICHLNGDGVDCTCGQSTTC